MRDLVRVCVCMCNFIFLITQLLAKLHILKNKTVLFVTLIFNVAYNFKLFV